MMVRQFGALFGAVAVLTTLPIEAFAADCDFQKRVGACRATIEIQSISGSKGSYSAEVVVKSSAPTCSKVDYFVDNTPYRTILKSTNAEDESLFGTKPISKKSIKVTSCMAFADRSNDQKQEPEQAKGGSGSFNGSWTGPVGMMMMKAEMTLNLRVSGTSVSGNSTTPNGEGYVIQNGRVNGNTITYTYQQPSGDGLASVRITRKSADSIAYSASASGITLSGTLSRQ